MSVHTALLDRSWGIVLNLSHDPSSLLVLNQEIRLRTVVEFKTGLSASVQSPSPRVATGVERTGWMRHSTANSRIQLVAVRSYPLCNIEAYPDLAAASLGRAKALS
jgi:hypothetical protein